MKNLLGSVIIIVLCFSCAHKKRSYPEIFSVKDTLQLTKLENISGEVLGKPRDLFIVGDYFVVRDEIEGNWFSLIRKSDGKLIRYFGTQGRGHGEILFPMIQEPFGENFYVYDASLQILHLFSLDSLLKGGNSVVKSIPIRFKTEKYARCRQVVLLPSGKILGNCCHPGGRLVLFDSNGYEQKVFCPDYPEDKLHPDEDYITKGFVFQYIGKIGGNDKFYNISNTTGHMEVFQLENDTLLEVKDNLYYLPKYKNTSPGNSNGIVFTEENQGGLFNPEISDRYLYGAYYDHTLKEHSYIVYNWLFQFDLKGKPVKAYHLSSRISGFFIEKDSEILYAISTDPVTLEPCLVYGKIK